MDGIAITSEAFAWLGAVTGLLGTICLAWNPRAVSAVFYVYFVSNVMWIISALIASNWPILFMNLGFLLVSMVGIFRSSSVRGTRATMVEKSI